MDHVLHSIYSVINPIQDGPFRGCSRMRVGGAGKNPPRMVVVVRGGGGGRQKAPPSLKSVTHILR